MKITLEQIKKYVTAFRMFADCMGIVEDSEDWVMMEKQFIVALCCMDLGIESSLGLMNYQVPPIVSVCFQSGRPLSSVFAIGREESVRLANNNG